MDLELLVDDLLLRFPRYLAPDLIGPIGAVDQHRRARRSRGERVELIDKVELVNADKVRRLQQVRRADRTGAKSQVRDRVGAGLLRVVHEVALGKTVGRGCKNLRR